ncbi:MAG: hypothetical protein AB1765_07040 [Candidatus Hydrogenedentota bacterium]
MKNNIVLYTILLAIFINNPIFAAQVYSRIDEYIIDETKDTYQEKEVPQETIKEATTTKPATSIKKKKEYKTKEEDINISVYKKLALPEFEERRNLELELWTDEKKEIITRTQEEDLKTQEITENTQPLSGVYEEIKEEIKSTDDKSTAALPPAIAIEEPVDKNNLSEVIVNDFKKTLQKERKWSLIFKTLKYTFVFILCLIILKFIYKPLASFVSKIINKLKRRRKRIEVLKSDEKIKEKDEVLKGAEDLLKWKKEEKTELDIRVTPILNEKKDQEYKGELGFHEIVEKKIEDFTREHPETLIEKQEEKEDDVIEEVINLTNKGYNISYISKQTGLTQSEIEMVIDIHKDRLNREKMKTAQG